MAPKKAAAAPKKKSGDDSNTNTQTVKVVINNNGDSEKPKKDLRKPPSKSTNQGRVYGVRGGRGRGLLPPYNPVGTIPGIPPPGPGQVINVNTAPSAVAPSAPYSHGPGSDMDWAPPSIQSMNTVSMAGSSIGGSVPDSYFSARTTNRERAVENMRRQMEQELADVEGVHAAVNEINPVVDEADVNIQRAGEWQRGEFERELERLIPRSQIQAAQNAPIGNSPLVTPLPTPRASEAGSSISIGDVPTRGENKRIRDPEEVLAADGSGQRVLYDENGIPHTRPAVPMQHPPALPINPRSIGGASSSRPWRG